MRATAFGEGGFGGQDKPLHALDQDAAIKAVRIGLVDAAPVDSVDPSA